MSLSREDLEKLENIKPVIKTYNDGLNTYNASVTMLNAFKTELSDYLNDKANEPHSELLKKCHQELQSIPLQTFNSINLDDYVDTEKGKELQAKIQQFVEAQQGMEKAKSLMVAAQEERKKLREAEDNLESAATANATPAAASASPAAPANATPPPAADPLLAESPDIRVKKGPTPTVRPTGGRIRSNSTPASPAATPNTPTSSSSGPTLAKSTPIAASASAAVVKSAPATPSSPSTSTPSTSPSSPPAPKPPVAPRRKAATLLTDDDRKRAVHVDNNFKMYIAKIDHIEGLVKVDKEKLIKHFSHYENSDPHKGIERLQKDLELYIAFLKEKNNNDVFIEMGFQSNPFIDRAEAYLQKLEEIASILNDPDDNLGMRHVSHSSLKITGTDDATFNEAIKESEKKLLEDYKLSSSTTQKPGTLSTPLPPSSAAEKDKQHTQDFHKLGAYEGRMNLTETKSHKSNKTEIISVEIQRLNKGAGETVVKFKQYDDSRSLHMPFGSPPVLLPNDRVLKHAIKIVTNHMLTHGKKPIYCNGNFPDTFVEAVMLFANRIGVECHDTRKGKDCKIIHELDPDRRRCFNDRIDNNPKEFLGEAAALYTAKDTIAKMVKATAEQAPTAVPATAPTASPSKPRRT